MSKMDCLKQAAIEHEQAYFNKVEMAIRYSKTSEKLARAMKDMGLQQFHFRDLTIFAGRFDLGLTIASVMEAITVEED